MCEYKTPKDTGKTSESNSTSKSDKSEKQKRQHTQEIENADGSTDAKRPNIEKQKRYIEHLKTPEKKTELEEYR